LVASVTRPVKELKGFKKVALKKGENQTISFNLTADDLAFYNFDLEWVSEPGQFRVFVGGSSNASNMTEFTLLD